MGWKMASDLEVRHCRTLIAVHDSGGVGAAARVLGVAQSTVSETLLSLERVLGVPVTVRRAGREALLSEPAIRLLPQARALVAASQAALAAAMAPGRTAIRLGAVESASSFLLPAPLGSFRRNRPDVDVTIVVGLCADLKKRVEKGDLDAALTVEAGDSSSGVELAELWRTRLALVVSPVHAMAGRKIMSGDLRGGRFLITEPSGDLRATVEAWLGQSGALVSAGSVDGVKGGVMAEDAIGILPYYAVRQDIVDGRLAEILSAEAPPSISVFLARRREGKRPPALEVLATELALSLATRGARS
jgi:DNA-binding transcriptional LysR family regulator